MIVRELITKLGFKVDEAQMAAANKKFNMLQGAMKGAVLGIGAAIVGIGVSAIKAAGDMESLNAEFEVMLGGSEKALAFTAEIRKMGAATPFTTKQLAENARLLLSFGIAQEKVLPSLQMIGDIAGKDANKMSSLTLAFSQVQSTGRLMGQDLLQMINAGFNPLESISKKTGISMGDLKKQMEKGAISADMVSQAFKDATSEGGRFYQNMEKQSKTLGGLLSTLQDMGETILINVGNKLLPTIKKLIQTLMTLLEGPLGKIIDQLAMALGPIIEVIGDLIVGLLPIISPIMDVVMVIMGYVQKLIPPILKIVKVVIDLVMLLFPFVGEIIGAIMDPIIEIVDLIGNLLILVLPLLKLSLLIGVVISTKIVKSLLLVVTIIAKVINSITKFITWLSSQIWGLVTSIAKFFVSVFTSIWGWISGKFYELVGLVNKVLPDNMKINIGNPAQTAEDIMKKVTAAGAGAAGGPVNNFDQTFNMGGAGGDMVGAIKEAARAAFSIELKKVLLSSV